MSLDLPAWCRTEKVPGNDAVYAVSREEMDRVFKRMPISDELRAQRAVG